MLDRDLMVAAHDRPLQKAPDAFGDVGVLSSQPGPAGHLLEQHLQAGVVRAAGLRELRSTQA